MKPIPKEYYEFKSLDLETDINISLIEDEIAYQKALKDLEKGDALELNKYLANRGLS